MQLGNLYFDAERYTDAVQWYEDALRLQPKDADVSTDLGVAYYYMNQPDKAIQQFEQSLKIDPAHTKTMLNMGIVKAFGKQDLAGASAAWQQVIATAPDSREAQAARKALEGLKQAHPGGGPSGGLTGDPAPPPAGRDGAAGHPRLWAALRRRGQGARGARPGAAPAARQPVKMTKDPVCGTFVVPGKALSLTAGGRTHWFCSERCRAEYASRS